MGVIDERDFWIFVVNRLQVVTLYKSFLTPEQRAELTTFLAARPKTASSRSEASTRQHDDPV